MGQGIQSFWFPLSRERIKIWWKNGVTWEINISENSGPLTSLPVNCLNVDQLQRWRSCHRSSSPGVSAKLRVCRIHLLKLLRENALLKTEWNFFDFSIWILIFRKNRSPSYCQAQPKLQLQLQLRLRLALIWVSPHHPPITPPDRKSTLLPEGMILGV